MVHNSGKLSKTQYDCQLHGDRYNAATHSKVQSTPVNVTTQNKHLHVACALIERDGLVLAAQRSATMNLPLKWEFPGGKLEAGESPEECLQRELVEEMGVTIAVGRALPLHTHCYETFTVTLYPFVCTLESDTITLHEHAAITWLPPEKLHTLDWLEADKPVLEAYSQLVRGLSLQGAVLNA
jgi:8-oxo-dGTP diphosphatase